VRGVLRRLRTLLRTFSEWRGKALYVLKSIEIWLGDDLAVTPAVGAVSSMRDWFRALALLEEFVTATAVLAYSNVAARRAMLAAWPEQLFAFALR